jgi:RNA ligase
MKILKQLIEDGFITERKHPECDYLIYNYTAKTQYDRAWNEDTLKCRGLILDGAGKIIARPFKKFFNYEEYQRGSFLGELPAFNSFNVYEKMDGSLGILYRMPSGEMRIATRGSFESEQAKRATEIFYHKYYHALYPEGFTFLFEIIYPENRIVVDYGDMTDLILLAVINNETGEEWSYAEMETFANAWGLRLVKQYAVETFNLESLKQVQEVGKEGFVIRFDNGLRVKMKFEEYVRLHRIITGVSSKTIWELLKDNKPLDEILDQVPDEFYTWVKQTAKDLQREYNLIVLYCKIFLAYIPDLTNAEECGILADVAKRIQKDEHASVLFAMWKDKPFDQIIWKLVKPQYTRPFKTEE